MGQPIVIANSDYSAADLRQLASREKDGLKRPGFSGGSYL
jgi:hypothetical protein